LQQLKEKLHLSFMRPHKAKSGNGSTLHNLRHPLQPITIVGKRRDAVLLSLEDWQTIQLNLFEEVQPAQSSLNA